MSKQDSPKDKTYGQNPKPLKSKRCKSNKRNTLSCQQILNVSKKRDGLKVNNFCDNSQRISNNLSFVGNKNKSKGKIKDHGNKSGNTSQNVRLINNREWHSSLNNYQTLDERETENNLVVNYPLSMSHSYIEFSEKDSTMNNTNIMNKLSKRLSSNSGQLEGLEDKLFVIRADHAATIIQKHWRGYLTRKLL